MKIRVVVPLTTKAFEQMTLDELSPAARPDTELSVVCLDKGPASIESRHEEALAVLDTVAKIVEADETDRSGLRAILNFGHTVGHAVEATTAFKKQRHGEAVSIGMIAASKISERLGMLSKQSVQKIDKVLICIVLLCDHSS